MTWTHALALLLGVVQHQAQPPQPHESLVRGAITSLRCRGKVVANCYGCNRLILCTAHKDGLCVPCQEGEEVVGGEEEEVVVDPNGVSIEQSAQCLLPVGTTTGHFLLSGWGIEAVPWGLAEREAFDP